MCDSFSLVKASMQSSPRLCNPPREPSQKVFRLSSSSLQTVGQGAQCPVAIEASLHLISPKTGLPVHLRPPRFFLPLSLVVL